MVEFHKPPKESDWVTKMIRKYVTKPKLLPKYSSAVRSLRWRRRARHAWPLYTGKCLVCPLGLIDGSYDPEPTSLRHIPDEYIREFVKYTNKLPEVKGPTEALTPQQARISFNEWVRWWDGLDREHAQQAVDYIWGKGK